VAFNFELKPFLVSCVTKAPLAVALRRRRPRDRWRSRLNREWSATMNFSNVDHLILARQALVELRRWRLAAISDAIQARASMEIASITSRALIAEADLLLARR